MNDNNPKNKIWWRPLWTGLVRDFTGKHSKKLKVSVWLLLYLFLSADYGTGVFSGSYSEISWSMGRSKSTIRKWLKTLERYEYVAAVRQGKKLLIRIQKWKTISKRPSLGTIEKESVQIRAGNVSEFGHIGKSLKGRKEYYSSQKIKNKGRYDDIDNNINKNVVNNVVRNLTSMNNENDSLYTKDELLAMEISNGLNDKENLRAYLSLCRKYPEPFLRKVYKEVKELPIEKIKKSRGALFTYLIQKLCREK
ncbi:MAG: helix-turn-helix domain-containing protein [Candidatus Paceibacterota bacterium]|jgi:DNA-binding transcriptional ArsR family regulator